MDVEENQVVKAGDAIAELDPADYQVAVENAQAALASAQANAAAANVNVPLTTINTGSNLSSAGADVSGAHGRRGAGRAAASTPRTPAWSRPRPTLTKAQADLDRYKPLVEKDVISKQQLDAAVAAADADQGRGRRRAWPPSRQPATACASPARREASSRRRC